MLILSRKPGDAILIDGGIRVVVLRSEGNDVRLGIEAPATVKIVREEIARGIADENVRARASAHSGVGLGPVGRAAPEPAADEPTDPED